LTITSCNNHHDIDNHYSQANVESACQFLLIFWRQQTVNALLALLAAFLSLNFIRLHNNVHYDAPILAVCRKKYCMPVCVKTLHH